MNNRSPAPHSAGPRADKDIPQRRPLRALRLKWGAGGGGAGTRVPLAPSHVEKKKKETNEGGGHARMRKKLGARSGRLRF